MLNKQYTEHFLHDVEEVHFVETGLSQMEF